MAGVDNLYVQETEKSMSELKEEGFWDGLAYNQAHPLPFVCFKPVYLLRPYEIGFLTGYLMAAAEGRVAREEMGNREQLDYRIAAGPTCPDNSCGAD